MKALVTGGAGFIGSHVVDLLLREGHSVTVLDNSCYGFNPNCQAITGDIRDPGMVDKAMKGAEVVFHLAASVGNAVSIDCPIHDAEVNVLGTLNILEAARRHQVRKVVFSSSASIFGELKTVPIREDHPVAPLSPYGATKLCAEKLCLIYSKLYGLEAVCLRYFNVFGINQRYDAYGNVIPIFAYKMICKEPVYVYGDGEQTRDFINVKDVARANLLAGSSHESGAFNLGSGSRVTINELLRKMERVSGLKATKVHLPARKSDVRHSMADISALGFKPSIGLDEGLTEYMDWARSEFKRSASL